jgi:hypothetical protein
VTREPAAGGRSPVPAQKPESMGAGVVASRSALTNPAAGRWRWLGSAVGLSLVAVGIGLAGMVAVPWFNLAVDGPVTGESPVVSVTMVAATPTATSPARPTATPSAIAIVPTVVPTNPPPAPDLVLPTQVLGPTIEQQVDEAIVQVLAFIDDQKGQSPDLMVEKLDKLRRDLDPASTKQPVVEELMVRVLVEDSQRRIKVAFVQKGANEGRDSQHILNGARQRFDHAAQIRPADTALQDRLSLGREQVDLTSWWVDFDAAYYAKQNDAQITALTRIMEKQPDFRTVEGAAKEKLFAAWISKAEESWAAKVYDQARIALDEAAKVDPEHPRTRELRTA